MSRVDDMDDMDFLCYRLARLQQAAGEVLPDIWTQDGLQLAGTVMRLDRIRDGLLEAWETLHYIYDVARERDRMLHEDRAVSRTPDGSVGVVADVFSAAATGVRGRASAVAGGNTRSRHMA